MSFAEQPIAPEEVAHAHFATTRFRQGYEMGQVDELLGACAAALRAHVDGEDATGLVCSADVAHAGFGVTRFRDGYEMQAVDAMLARVQDSLATHEAHR